jgi:hypothetical protein
MGMRTSGFGQELIGHCRRAIGAAIGQADDLALKIAAVQFRKERLSKQRVQQGPDGVLFIPGDDADGHLFSSGDFSQVAKAITHDSKIVRYRESHFAVGDTLSCEGERPQSCWIG